MLDVHTHILPGMDDGSRSPEQSLAMLARQVEQGVNTVVLTPHYDASRESPPEFVQRRARAESELLAALQGAAAPHLLSGAEVAFFEGVSSVENLEALCIGSTGCMLLEMPFCTWSRRMLSELSILQEVRGVKLILAHVERYRTFQPAGLLEELHSSGMHLQCNASFFLRWQTRRLALSMLRKQMISFVASDCHGLDYRPPNLGDAWTLIGKKLGRPALDFLQRQENLLTGGMT